MTQIALTRSQSCGPLRFSPTNRATYALCETSLRTTRRQQGAGTGQAAQRTSSETAAVIRKQPAAVTAGKAPSQTTGGASNSRDTVSARVDSSPQGTHDSGSFPQPPRTTSSRVGGGRAGATRAVAPLTGAGTSSKFGATPPPGQVAAGSNFAVAGIRNTRVECEGCAGAEGDGRVDRELLEEFGVTICRKCKVRGKLREPSQGWAASGSHPTTLMG